MSAVISSFTKYCSGEEVEEGAEGNSKMNHREARCKSVECCSTFSGQGPAWVTCGGEKNGKRQRLSCPCARHDGRWGSDGVGPLILSLGIR